MFSLLAVLLALSFPAPAAFAGAPVVLMVNMNYSTEELKALEEQAAARGQRVEMVPPKGMEKLVEPMFRKRDALEEELRKQFPGESPLKLKGNLAGIMRRGAGWEGDRRVAEYLGTARMNEMAALAAQVEQKERQHGSIYEQLQRKAAELKAKGDRVDSIVFSSHSDGSNLTGETANRLSANDLTKLKLESPELFETPRHVLLLGCYNLTKPNHKAWRYDLFPNASMISGFGIRAPSRFDEKSANYIRQVMSTADRLDREMVAAGKPLDAAYLDRTFKSLSTFTTEAHPGVVDYCMTVTEGRPETWSRDCEAQWKDLRLKQQEMEAYWSLRDPREDPPTVGGGKLRNFYNTLQMACPAQESSSERDDWRGAERLRVTLREQTIRLIYWWNVQSNFATHFQADIDSMNQRLAAAGAARMPKLDGTTSRVQFVSYYNSARETLRDRNPGLLRDFTRLYGPLFYLKGEDTVAAGEALSIEATLARNAIPFNWIEGTTVMRSR